MKWIFLNENVWISLKISLQFVPQQIQNSNTGSDNGLAPISHYLSQWLVVYWRIYAALGLNELSITSMELGQSRSSFDSNG